MHGKVCCGACSVMAWALVLMAASVEAQEVARRSRASNVAQSIVVVPAEAEVPKLSPTDSSADSVGEVGESDLVPAVNTPAANTGGDWTDFAGTSMGCSPAGGWRVEGDYLLWWLKGNLIPPLVTTSPDGTPRPEAGVLPDAEILFGDERVDTNLRSGMRLTVGRWFDEYTALEVEGLYVGTGDSNGSFSATSEGFPILARPFFNTNLGQADAQLVAYREPDGAPVLAGGIDIRTASELYSGGIWARSRWWTCGQSRVDWLGGYRYLRLRERLLMDESVVSTATTGTIPVGTTFDIVDDFVAASDFHGGEIGLATVLDRGCWSLDVLTRLAFGNMHQVVNVNGQTTVTVPNGTPSISSGGLLALPSNIGRYSEDTFAFIPQLNIDLHYQINPCWRFTVGYSLLYITNVLRSGDQVNLNVNPTQMTWLGQPGLDGDPAPLTRLTDTSVWAQGMNLGLELRY